MAALVIFYDIWAGLGVLAIALLAKFFFAAAVMANYLWSALIVIGVAIVNVF